MRLPVKRRIWLAGGVLVVLLGVAGGVLAFQAYRLPKRFAAVVAGHLYRSGAVSPGQLERCSAITAFAGWSRCSMRTRL